MRQGAETVPEATSHICRTPVYWQHESPNDAPISPSWGASNPMATRHFYSQLLSIPCAGNSTSLCPAWTAVAVSVRAPAAAHARQPRSSKHLGHRNCLHMRKHILQNVKASSTCVRKRGRAHSRKCQTTHPAKQATCMHSSNAGWHSQCTSKSVPLPAPPKSTEGCSDGVLARCLSTTADPDEAALTSRRPNHLKRHEALQ